MNRLLYISISIIALCIYVLQKSEIVLPSIINNYANDFLCLPIVLGGLCFTIRLLKKDESFVFPPVFILLMSCYYSFYFEYYLPKNNPRYTADWIDIVLYFAGGIVYYFVSKQQNVLKSHR